MLTGFLFLLQLLFQTPNTLGIWLNCIPTLLIQKGGPEMIKNMSVATQSRNVRVKDGTRTCQTPEFKCFKVLVPRVWSAGTVQGKRFHLLKNIWPPVITPPHSSNFGSTWIARIPQHVGIQPVHPTPSVLQGPPYMVSLQAPWEGSRLLAQDPRQPTRDSLQMEGTGPCPHGQPSEDMYARKAKEGLLKVVRYWCINTHVGNAPSALRPPKLKPWGWVPALFGVLFALLFVLAFILFRFYFIFQTFIWHTKYWVSTWRLHTCVIILCCQSVPFSPAPPYHPSSWIPFCLHLSLLSSFNTRCSNIPLPLTSLLPPSWSLFYFCELQTHMDVHTHVHFLLCIFVDLFVYHSGAGLFCFT